MLKHIKKSIKYFVIIFGVILLLPTVLYLLLQTSEVQTFIVRRITNDFSTQIKSTISVGSIEYKFFNKLSANDIIIKDQNNDTLFYSKEITIGIKGINLKKKSFRLGKVSLVHPVIALITDSTGLMNLTWYLNLIKNPDDTVKKGGSRFVVDQIDIDNARFSIVNKNADKGKARIDFNNLHLSGVNGIVEELKIFNDTTSFHISDFDFTESSGFRVKKINSSVLFTNQRVAFSSAFIMLDSSILNIPKLSLVPDSSGSFKKFIEEVKLDIRLDKSLINTSDLQYFVPFIDSLNMNESVWLSGKIMGTISELRGRNIKLSYRNYTSLDCDFDFSGLPKIDNTYLYIGVNSLRTNIKDIEQINLNGKEFLVVPDALKKIGNISFNGSFTGFTTDFVTYGELRTNQGNIRTDISLRPEESKRYRIKGLINGSDINLGELTGNTDFLGNLSIHANVDGYASSLKQFAANLTGKIDSIEINRYIYRNIALNGSFTEKTWDGSININDKNIKLDLLGLLNFKNDLPDFDFTLNIANANLYKLNFDKLDTSSNATLLLTANFKGNNIDNLDGDIKLLNSKFRKFSNNLELYDFSIKSFKERNIPTLSLRTDFVDADIKGFYNFATIGSLINSTLADLMPTQFHYKNKKNDFRKNKFDFEINFKNTDKINDFFRTGISIADKSYIKGSVFADSLINIGGYASLLTIKNNVFKDFSFNTTVAGSELAMNIKSSSLNLLKQSELKDFSIVLNTKPDNFTFTVNWDNKDKILNEGTFIARGTVVKNMSEKPGTFLKIDIDSSHIYSDNNLWRLRNSDILIDSNAININKFYITSNERSYLINGSVSENPADTLHLEFKGIDVAPLGYLINRKNENDPNMVHLDCKGSLNGKIVLTNVYKNLLLMGNITVDHYSMLGSEFGDISINSELDNARKGINIKASNSLNSVKTFNVSGVYYPNTKRIDLNARAIKLPIGFLNTLLKTFASEITGTVSGNLNLAGEADNLILKGAVMTENASMKINYLQTKYSMKDSVRFDKDGIKFNNVKITDIKGNYATLSGAVYHQNFQDYKADLIITINSSNFQVLNTQQKDNPLFYGTAYGSGVAKMKSDQNSLSFDISAKTGKNSKLSIPLSKGLSVSEYSYISFEGSNKDKLTNSDTISIASRAKQVDIDLNMNLEITPDAEIQIIFDEKLGDIMKGNGSSENLNVNINKKGDFSMTGDYIIDQGKYTFTYGNILNKTFDVENGGKILFNGDLKDAEIDLKASYLHLKASLAPVLGSSYYERINVEPQLNLTGKLFNPIVAFGIYLPDADEQTRTYLRNAISTEEELTKQVFALLLMNSFISAETYSTLPSTNTPLSTSTTGTSAMAAAATTFEMASNQISNWLSQISKDVDIGLNIRPGSNEITPQEAELALSTQLLNNKVVLNGNFDVRGTGSTTGTSTTNTTNQLTGDFNAEIKLTEKLQFKVFNRFNDTYSNSGLSPYTQGIGIFYKQDFNRFSDLFRKKIKADMKKEDETKIKGK